MTWDRSCLVFPVSTPSDRKSSQIEGWKPLDQSSRTKDRLVRWLEVCGGGTGDGRVTVTLYGRMEEEHPV